MAPIRYEKHLNFCPAWAHLQPELRAVNDSCQVKPSKPKLAAMFVEGGLPIVPPPGEDFFLACIHIATSDPCWDDAASTFGNWASISRNISLLLAQGNLTPKDQIRI